MHPNTKRELIPWLHEQLAKAERAVIAREQMAGSVLDKTDFSEMPGVTIGRVAPARRLENPEVEAARHQRIAAKDRRDVAMIKAAISIISNSAGHD